ncbi:HPP family-domain-containing protein, partial [Dimargaris cristalligena]
PTPPNNFLVCVWSFIASFIAIATLSMPTYLPSYFRAHDIPLIIGSFGASAVLIYGSVEAPLSQPRNLVLGHISSAIWGVVVNTIFNAATEDHDKIRWLSCALAVSGSIVIMQILDCVHPPGGATALIAVSGGSEIYDLGFLYIAVPVILGVVIMLGVALVFNNIQRHFPVYWW